jgi:hypothetical protein
MYMDNSLGQSLAEDIYESNLKLWKVFSIGLSRGDKANYGLQSFGGGLTYLIWDVQNDHPSYLSTFGSNSRAACRSGSTPRSRIITRTSRAIRRPPV